MAHSRSTDTHSAAARRALGRVLAALGWGLAIVNLLVLTGLVPLWQPSLPPPVALTEPAPLAPVPTPPSWSLAYWVALAAPRPAPPPPAPDAPDPEIVLLPAPVELAASESGSLPSGVAADAPLTASSPPSATLPGASFFRQALPVSQPPGPTPTLTPIVLPTAVPPLPPPGQPLRLAIPSIQVDTPVVELHTTAGANGALEWETVPFVAGHYSATGPAGTSANVVLSGHVTTTDRGNVFRDLYKIRRGEALVVHTAQGQFTYRVVDVRLVKPNDVSVVAPSPESRLTLITCAGQFDYRTHTYSERLVVVGQLVTM